MNFLLLCIQSTVCCVCVSFVKKLGIISFRDFDVQDAKHWFPISFLLVSVIYTGSKSLVSSLAYLGPSTPLSGRTAIPQHPRLHDIQEPHDYTDCMLRFNPVVIPYLRLRQAYGEVIWFGGRVTGLTLVSFFFMVRWQTPVRTI